MVDDVEGEVFFLVLVNCAEVRVPMLHTTICEVGGVGAGVVWEVN